MSLSKPAYSRRARVLLVAAIGAGFCFGGTRFLLDGPAVEFEAAQIAAAQAMLFAQP